MVSQVSIDQPQPAALSQLIQAGTFAVTRMKLSENGQMLLIGGVGFAVLYRLNESQAETNLTVVEARFSYNATQGQDPSDQSKQQSTSQSNSAQQPTTGPHVGGRKKY